MSELETRIRTLVQSTTRESVEAIEPIAGGLGAHDFFRVHCSKGRSVIARVERDRAAGSGPEPPLEGIRSFLEDAGLPVPHALLHSDGLDLLEDLGTTALSDLAAEGLDETVRALYAEACALPAQLQALQPPASPPPAFARRWADFLPLKRERTLAVALPDWLGRPPRPAERDCANLAFDAIEAGIRDAPMRLAHRDFQGSNLMVNPNSSTGAGKSLVMIDLQGAFMAPPEYDLMCLLRDSYVELPVEWVRELGDAARRLLPDAPDPQTFDRRFDLLCIARKSKDDAFFVEAARRGDTRYTHYRETNRRYLVESAKRLAPLHPCFATWVEWLAASPEEGARACAP